MLSNSPLMVFQGLLSDAFIFVTSEWEQLLLRYASSYMCYESAVERLRGAFYCRFRAS